MEKSVSYLLSADMARKAIEMVRPAILAAMESGELKRKAIHVVVMNPATRPWEVDDEADAILYEEFIGDVPRAEWSAPYDEIARTKAIESWRTGFPTHVIRETMPYLLVATESTSDTLFWGSAVLHGLVVGASGVESYFDEWASYLVAATCRALCIQKMQTLFKDKRRNFLWEPALDSPGER